MSRTPTTYTPITKEIYGASCCEDDSFGFLFEPDWPTVLIPDAPSSQLRIRVECAKQAVATIRVTERGYVFSVGKGATLESCDQSKQALPLIEIYSGGQPWKTIGTEWTGAPKAVRVSYPDVPGVQRIDLQDPGSLSPYSRLRWSDSTCSYELSFAGSPNELSRGPIVLVPRKGN